MICLGIFSSFIIPVFLFFVFDFFFTRNYLCSTSVVCFIIFITAQNLQNSDNPFRLLSVNFRLYTRRYNDVNYGAWHVYKPFFGSSFVTFRLAYSEMSLSMNEKKLHIVQNGKWRDSFS